MKLKLFFKRTVLMLAIAMPVMAWASNPAQLVSTINSFAHGGTGSLVAEYSGNTVTVNGYVINVTEYLLLNIDPYVRVVWKATYSGSHSDALMGIDGVGTFELADGADITGYGPEVLGTIVTTNTPSILVSGGKVHSTTSNAIFSNSTVSVSGGMVSTGTGSAIFVGVGKNVTVSGGTVSATGDLGHAIRISIAAAGDRVWVNGGTVIATTGVAIGVYAPGYIVQVDKGTVNATTGVAIGVNNDNSTIAVYGGEVGVTIGAAIALNGANSTVTVSGGKVYATNQAAIAVAGAASTVTINGDGFVFAHGTALTGEGNVINMVNGGSPTISNNSVVCAWNNMNTTYSEGTTTDLTFAPSDATVKWGKNDGQSGIIYTNGANTGFFEISGVTIETTGIETVAHDELRIYPNPTKGMVFIRAESDAVLQLSDIQGKRLLTTTGRQIGVIQFVKRGNDTFKEVKQ